MISLNYSGLRQNYNPSNNRTSFRGTTIPTPKPSEEEVEYFLQFSKEKLKGMQTFLTKLVKDEPHRKDAKGDLTAVEAALAKK